MTDEIERLRTENRTLMETLEDAEGEIERLRALLRPFVNLVAEPEDFAAARKALEGKSHD